MYKVMIVDDEILVRIGLRSMINWEKLGFQIVDEASNGESAYEKFMVSRPDVILTDIKMPLRDGLWLIEKVKKEKPETEIVILTAYDDFDYARKAVKLQASEYLLKAEMEEQEVEKVMISLREKLDKVKKEMESDTLSVKSEDMEQQERLLGLLLSEYKPVSLVKEQFDKLNISWNKYQCCFVQFDFQEAMQEKEYANEQVVSIISACRQLINARFQSRYKYCIMKQFGKSITLLLMNERLSQEKLEEDIRELQASIHQYFDIAFKSANSKIETDIEKVRENAAWIFQASQRLFYIQAGQHEVQKTDRSYNKEELSEERTEGEVYTERHIARLAECVMNTDEETVSSILKEIRENSLRLVLVPLDFSIIFPICFERPKGKSFHRT